MLTVALGVGVNSVVFSLFDRLLFRPLPYGEPSRLVQLHSQLNSTDGHRMLPTAITLELAREKELFSGIAWAQGGDLEPLAPVPGANPLLWLTGVTTNALEVLDIRPVIGVGFSAMHATALQRPVLLTYEAWQRGFGGTPDVLSLEWTARDPAQREVYWRVVGVLPEGFLLPSSRPASAVFDGIYGLDPGFDRQPSLRAVGVAPFARLAPGLSVSAARAAVDAIVASRFPRLRDSMPGGAPSRVLVEPLQSGLSTAARSYAWLATVGAWGVLGSTCLTLALLMLTWTQSRQRDAGVRLALGASPRSLVVSTLVESVVLCSVGAVIGWLAFAWTRSLFVSVLPPDLQSFVSGPADPRVILTTGAIALVSALVAGVLPAIRRSRTAPLDVLRPQSGAMAFDGLVGGPALLSLQAAFGLVLLVGSCATLPEVVRNLWSPPGFQAADLYVVGVPTSNDETAGDAREQLRRGRQALEVARALPGVAAASLSQKDPLWASVVERQFLGSDPTRFPGRLLPVDWDFFTTLGTPFVAGRSFSPAEVEQQALVAIVSVSGARLLAPDVPSAALVGHTVTTEDGPRVVVGVVEDFQVGGEAGIGPALFLPLSADEAYRKLRNNPNPWMSYALVLRMTPGRIPDMTLLSDQLREQSWIPVWIGARRESVSAKLGVELGTPRLLALVFGTLGAITLLLAVIAIYGLASFEIRRRREEMTVRLALGATPNRLRRRLVLVTARPIVVGVVAALPISWALVELLTRSVRTIDSSDPWIYVTAAGAMVAVAMVAAWIPGWRSITVRVAELLRTS